MIRIEIRYQFGYPINRRIMTIADALNSPVTLETQHEEYRGKYRPLQIIEVPIELPTYRIENIRTKSLQKQWLVTHPDCDKNFFSTDVGSIEVQEAQHQILKSLADKEGLLDTFKKGSLQQKEALIVTDEGVVVNGNRRLCAWRELYYCFLLWFLQNNLYRTDDELKGYTQYIVDGNDDNSCDLIFSNKEDGETVYYVVQAKWFAKQNINKSNDLTNIYKACLTDFNMILRHRKEESKTNKKFNTMYRKLKKHVENNGKVRFLLVTLCVSNPDFRIKELDEYCSSPLV